MVQLWYPAASAKGPLAAYAPPGEAAALQKFYPVPAGAFTATTNSHLHAPVAPGRHEVVFFEHGLCGSRTDSTIVAEELASRGYVVAGMGDTGESAAVEFPGGRVVAPTDPAYCQAGADPFSTKGQQVLKKLLSTRVADVKFVADELTAIDAGQNPDADKAPMPAGISGSLNVDTMGIYGHSFGGGTAAAVIAEDSRFVAGVDLDGFAIGPVAKRGVDKPFLVVGTSDHDGSLDASWKTFLPALAAGSQWHRWYGVKNTGHYRFIDLGGSVTKWHLQDTLKKQDPQTWKQVFGDINDAESQRINRDLVTAFFDKFLRHRSSQLLADPSRYLPDVYDRSGQMSAP